jgi:hypothetical protein
LAHFLVWVLILPTMWLRTMNEMAILSFFGVAASVIVIFVVVRADVGLLPSAGEPPAWVSAPVDSEGGHLLQALGSPYIPFRFPTPLSLACAPLLKPNHLVGIFLHGFYLPQDHVLRIRSAHHIA